MTDQNSSDTSSNEGPIARARRRTRELGEEGLALAKREAEQLFQDLGRKPSGTERILLEQVVTLNVRARTLRAWGRANEADGVARLLISAISVLHKFGIAPKALPPLDRMRGDSIVTMVDSHRTDSIHSALGKLTDL
jgi:hypothetical protein